MNHFAKVFLLLWLLLTITAAPAHAISINLPAPSTVVSNSKSNASKRIEVSKEIRAAVVSSQAAITNGQWQRCIDLLQTIEPTRLKTDFDRFKVAELLAYCAQRSGNNALTSSALEETLRYPDLLGASYAQRVEIFAQIRFLAGDFAAAEKYTRVSLAAGRKDDETYLLLVDSLINLERFPEARDVLGEWIDVRSASKSELSQPLLEKRLYACTRLGDTECTREMLEILASFYPSDRLWRSLLAAILDGAFRSDVQRVARLAHEFAIGLEPSDYTYVGAALIESGYSLEAVQFLETAIERRFLRDARYLEAARKLIARARTQAEAESKSFAKRESAAARDSNGQAEVRLGREVLFSGNPEKAIALVQRGLGKGLKAGLDDAQVTLGLAYLRSGDLRAATQAFSGIPENVGIQTELRRAWLLSVQVRGGQPVSGYQAFTAANLGIGVITPSVLVTETKPAPVPAPPSASEIEVVRVQLAAAAAASKAREQALEERLKQEIASREEETKRLLAAVEAAAKRQRELEEQLKREPISASVVSATPRPSAERPTRRFALAIGNNQYQHVSPLEKAVNDAVAVADGLKKIGYETTVLVDATQRQINSAVNRFVRDVSEGGQGVFFFAGHGLQINNQNFLLPTDFEAPNTELDVLDQGVSLQVVQDKLTESRAKFTLLILDACRDSPFPRRYLRSALPTRGLAQASSADGQMIVFSAGANQRALDKLGDEDNDPNGVFTRELLPWFERDEVSIRSAILEVRRSVNAKARSVNHQQTPAVYDQALGDFYFRR